MVHECQKALGTPTSNRTGKFKQTKLLKTWSGFKIAQCHNVMNER